MELRWHTEADRIAPGFFKELPGAGGCCLRNLPGVRRDICAWKVPHDTMVEVVGT